MNEIESMSARRPLQFWGWGYADEKLSEAEVHLVDSICRQLLPGGWQQRPRSGRLSAK